MGVGEGDLKKKKKGENKIQQNLSKQWRFFKGVIS